MIEKFKEYYKDTKKKIDQKIEAFNEELVKEDNSLLRENFEYFKNLNSEGKLVRGTLVNLGYYLLKEEEKIPFTISMIKNIVHIQKIKRKQNI